MRRRGRGIIINKIEFFFLGSAAFPNEEVDITKVVVHAMSLFNARPVTIAIQLPILLLQTGIKSRYTAWVAFCPL